MSFFTSVALVLEQIDTVCAWRRATRTKRLAFAVDLCLVAHGVRSGYLVDTLCTPDLSQAFTALLKGLRVKSTTFDDVACWYHTPTAQSFYVHVPLLRERLVARDCIFVHLDRKLLVSKEFPDGLREVLGALSMSLDNSPNALSHSLSDALTQVALVPLAAVTIDYPIAYVPRCTGQTSFLEGEPLDIYTVSFSGPSGLGDEHTLLRFSCPQILPRDHPELSPDNVIEQLRAKFTPRLDRIGAHMVVAHYTETMDRVAL